jgi:hypothetical protein
MQVEVTYATEFGCSESIMDLDELPSFVKNFTIFNVVPYNSMSLDDFAIEFGQWLLNQPYRVKYNDKKELLEIYKQTL